MLCCFFFYRPAAASKVAHPSVGMSVFLLGALGHQCDIKSTKNVNSKLMDILAQSADIWYSIYMQNCK